VQRAAQGIRVAQSDLDAVAEHALGRGRERLVGGSLARSLWRNPMQEHRRHGKPQESTSLVRLPVGPLLRTDVHAADDLREGTLQNSERA
jgi:hypothetical protein